MPGRSPPIANSRTGKDVGSGILVVEKVGEGRAKPAKVAKEGLVRRAQSVDFGCDGFVLLLRHPRCDHKGSMHLFSDRCGDQGVDDQPPAYGHYIAVGTGARRNAPGARLDIDGSYVTAEKPGVDNFLFLDHG